MAKSSVLKREYAIQQKFAVLEILVHEYPDWIRRKHPILNSLLDQKQLHDPAFLNRHFEALEHNSGHLDFSTERRGNAYRERQKRHPEARAIGYRKIYELASSVFPNLSDQHIWNDCLGGNGSFERGLRLQYPVSKLPYMITSDPCPAMVIDAMNQGLAAIRQAAQATLFADHTVDIAFAGYGLHHIERTDRPQTCREIYRILNPGGLVILHDFEEGSPTARWYSELLDRYTLTGHAYEHCTASELTELLEDADFTSIKIQALYEPFVFTAPTARMAREALLEHLREMFGLVKLQRVAGESEAEYFNRLEQTFRPYCTFKADEVAFDDRALRGFTVDCKAVGGWRAEFPRVALVATALKPLSCA
ncbi:MAG: class I SAM-dependent methyltransferase [Methylococcales bacterium]